MHSWIKNFFFTVFILQTGLFFTPASLAEPVRCKTVHSEHAKMLAEGTKKIAQDRGAALPERSEATKALMQFAVENNLPYRWIELGPAERRVQRLFVGLDTDNPALVQKYLETFNLHKATKYSEGTLALEFAKESIASPEHYVTGVLRTSENPDAPIYRWGREDLPRSGWWETWIMTNSYVEENRNTGVLGFSHLFGLNKAQKDNLEFFLKNPDQRAACKSDNCVAWTSGIELGKTDKASTDDERRFLFSELGVGRSMAHFEIGRRLIHAANENHTAIVVFLKGDKGVETFKNSLPQFLVPEPKIPYFSIIRGVDVAPSPAALNAVDVIPDGAKVFVPIAAGASPEGVAALIHNARKKKKGWDVHVLVNGISASTLRKGVETTDGKFRLHALFLGGNMRDLYLEQKLSVIPGNLSDFTRLMRDPENDQFHYDAILVRVAPVDYNGRYSLGPNSDMIMTILRNRPDIKVIAEINENIPVTNGDNYLTANQIHASFVSRTELAGPPVVPVSEVDTRIGDYLGSLISSDSYLQVGIGNVFGGLAAGLQKHQKSNIKISTEMFGDALKDLMEKGIATEAETGFAYGSKSLYKWLKHNNKVKFVETEYVNNPGRVSQLEGFHAVNTALQVNLLGETNATMGPQGRISSPGGQVEFMTGAARSERGKAIIAIRSTAKNNTLSSIVLNLYKGPITTPHESVTHVVTEYGVAVLRGKSESERAAALIRIAHPKFRDELIEEALKAGLISQKQAAVIPRN